MSLYDISNTALVIALFTYIASFVMFTISITGRSFGGAEAGAARSAARGRRAFAVAMIGLGLHLIFFVLRWIANRHIPVSNLFEFMTFLAMMIVVAFAIIYRIYRKPLLGAFATPVAFIILAYAMVFPWEAQPLIPSLNSYWLYIHVTTAATGEAFFAVAFAAGLMYLLRVVDYDAKGRRATLQKAGIEFTLFSVLIVVGFILAAFTFRGMGYEAAFVGQQTVEGQTTEVTVEYTMPPIYSPHGYELVAMDSFLGSERPLMTAPEWMKGVNAGRKLNTAVWSVLFGIALYAILRLAFRKPLGRVIHPRLAGIDPEDIDEITYRAVAIGFPIFTLGALIFAMIWAHIAWNRFWGWDPKEVWALVTWLFYSVYLHLRLGRGWQGNRSAWLAVIGFIVVMFTLIGVNLIIAGLHSYAGV
ncbi:c-type cytochrome biogenesis protein CcsB [Paenibacillus antri]|uniref:C-type cytochrome biogenesis protein CcsB n=1 Tax=Paenibacillus antri TaxID=2582848 RepID=A0A5R9G9E7_9BACL|nr:cytochrome c biogenesis protein CcsA [Paenibacillus antri]TLS53057.1 c-type cytochrome biogenesis protein CcsB [Paenibacillus antri]